MPESTHQDHDPIDATLPGRALADSRTAERQRLATTALLGGAGLVGITATIHLVGWPLAIYLASLATLVAAVAVYTTTGHIRAWRVLLAELARAHARIDDLTAAEADVAEHIADEIAQRRRTTR